MHIVSRVNFLNLLYFQWTVGLRARLKPLIIRKRQLKGLWTGIIFIIISLNSLKGLAVSCHPAVDSQVAQYIVGYGSLLQTESKQQTYFNTGENIPVVVKGYQRGWLAQGTTGGLGATFLGVTANKKASFNGVIFKLLKPASISRYDDREKMYCRVEIAAANISSVNFKTLPQGQYWIYIPIAQIQIKPSEKYPIIQSYVDNFIGGCLEIQEKYLFKNFAKECITTTEYWSDYWINDRIYPRRPFVYQPKAGKIDQLLKDNLPDHFSHIKIE
jgi:hypothetical protein